MTDIMEYINPELLVLIPVLYVIGMVFKNIEMVKDKHIPLFLGLIGIVLALLYSLTVSSFCIEVVYTAIIQGILVTAVAVYGNQLYVQHKKDE